MGILKGLAGISLDETPCLFIEKASEIEVVLRNGYAATSANNNGALNVWKDDEGKCRCESMRYMVKIESKIYSNISGAMRWTEKWLEKIK